MDQQVVIYIARRTLMTGLTIVMPMLVAGLLVGVVVALFQAVTQIREMTLTFIPKILAVVGILIWLLPWMITTMVSYTLEMFHWMNASAGF